MAGLEIGPGGRSTRYDHRLASSGSCVVMDTLAAVRAAAARRSAPTFRTYMQMAGIRPTILEIVVLLAMAKGGRLDPG